MGCTSGKQSGEQENYKDRSKIKRLLHCPSRRTSNSKRLIKQYDEEHHRPTQLLSTFDSVSPDELETETNINTTTNNSAHLTLRQITETEPTLLTADQFSDNQTPVLVHDQQTSNQSSASSSQESLISSNENDWKYYLPLTLEKIRTISILKDLIYPRVNYELTYVLNRIVRIERSDENDEFFNWFCHEIECFMYSSEENDDYEHKSLLLRAIEQDRYDCMRYLFDHHLLPTKLTINTINDQGRHCLLMLAHKNGPLDSIKYLLTHHLACLDTNKLDLNKCSSLHYGCRHFNLSLSEFLLPHTNRKILQLENSEVHTPLDYWIECLCSLKKLKPTHPQHYSESLRLDYLLNDPDYHANVLFFQTVINHGGQLTKIPLRYMRSVLPQLTFEQKLSFVDHHVNLCCTLYKNRLSTLIRDYDHLKISIQAGEILTEFIYALGTVQLEVQNRLAAHVYSSVYETAIQRIYRDNQEQNFSESLTSKEHDALQLHMRMLYFKFFRLFQCIYNNPDVNAKSFQFEYIFRRVWIYWKVPVKAFVTQCREKNSSLKAICRILLFKRLNHYPADIQDLPINSSLKQYLAYDNQFFVVQRKY